MNRGRVLTSLLKTLERSRAAEISSVATLVVSHEDLLVYLAIQFGMHLSKRDAFGGYVGALCDIRGSVRDTGLKLVGAISSYRQPATASESTSIILSASLGTW